MVLSFLTDMAIATRNWASSVQAERGITEMGPGLDLVQWQLKLQTSG